MSKPVVNHLAPSCWICGENESAGPLVSDKCACTDSSCCHARCLGMWLVCQAAAGQSSIVCSACSHPFPDWADCLSHSISPQQIASLQERIIAGKTHPEAQRRGGVLFEATYAGDKEDDDAKVGSKAWFKARGSDVAAAMCDLMMIF